MDKTFNERTQQYLREWILKQPYFSLNGKYDGMTAWELSGIILKQINEFVSFNSPDYYEAEKEQARLDYLENVYGGIETTETKVFNEIINEA